MSSIQFDLFRILSYHNKRWKWCTSESPVLPIKQRRRLWK